MQTDAILEKSIIRNRILPSRPNRRRIRYKYQYHQRKVGNGLTVDEAVRRCAWGIAASIDIYNCNPETIRNESKIRQFVVELCDLIGMRRFGETQVVHFGEDERVAGFSMIQLIETSLISAHFANQSNTTYLDVFSCKPYDPTIAEEFARKFFGGSHCISHVNLRL